MWSFAVVRVNGEVVAVRFWNRVGLVELPASCRVKSSPWLPGSVSVPAMSVLGPRRAAGRLLLLLTSHADYFDVQGTKPESP